jgi:probable phosphoglycerate mutase
MTQLALIRHGPTVWNDEGRLQGQTDIPLSDAGRAAAAAWRIPEAFFDFELVVSPLQRCVETADLLRRTMPEPPVPRYEPRLVEMSWGRWEGRTVAELRDAYGDGMAINEGRGLDFRPHGGESPRDVQQRVIPVLAEIGAAGRPTIAVIHRGVMRAIYALATGWDMRSKPPHRLLHRMPHGHALLFDVAADGSPHLYRLDLPLSRGAAT